MVMEGRIEVERSKTKKVSLNFSLISQLERGQL
jgi:hypothetical protein